MKKISMLILAFSAAIFSMAQTADEIVEKHLAALGGVENLRKVNSAVMEGSLTVQGMEVTVKVQQLNAKGMRQDITVMGMTGQMVSTPVSGWMLMPFQGQTKPEPSTPEMVKAQADDLDLQGNLLDYKEKGHTIELLGKEDVEGSEAFKLKIIRKTSGEQTIFIDADSYLIIRTSTKVKADGQEREMSQDFSDYREINGVKIPFSLSGPFGVITMKSIKLNEPVDEKIFEQPKG